MRRFACMFLAFVLIITLCSCASQKKQIHVPVTYYYRTASVDCGTETGVITSEIREARGYKDDYRYLIEQYLNGPRSSSCISAFPAGTTLEEFNLESNKVQVTLSPHLAILSGAELMVACACLSKTLIEMTGIDTVEIRAENGLLNSEESITLKADSFSYWDFGSDYPS